MFGLWFPHSLIRSPNPVFQYDMRRLGWPRDRAELKQYSKQIILAVCGIFGLWWLAERSRLPWYRSAEGNIALLLVLLAGGVTLLSNLYYAILTVGTINREITSSQWDQLRLTTLDGERILLAKYAILQIRAWRMMIVDTALRLAGAGIVFLAYIYGVTASFRNYAGVPYSREYLYVWPQLAAIAVLGIGFALEPLWRMRMVLSVGMVVSTTLHSFAYAILGVLGIVVLSYLAQILMMIGFGYFVLRIFAASPPSALLFNCMAPLVGMAIFLGCYAFYRVLRDSALEYTSRVAFGGHSLRLYMHQTHWS
jgi:hypothetical protein